MDTIEKQGFLAYASLSTYQKKVEKAKQLIKEALDIAPAYVAISWGKDSTVLLHLCQSIQPSILAVYHAHTERDLISNYSETIKKYCDRFSTNLKLIETDDADQKMINFNPHQDYPVGFLGIRAEENIRRKRILKKYGLLHQYQSGKIKGAWRCAPLGWWGWRDIWAYIVSHDLPYLKAYDESLKDKSLSRTTDHISKSLNTRLQQERFKEFAITNPLYYNYLKSTYPDIFV